MSKAPQRPRRPPDPLLLHWLQRGLQSVAAGDLAAAERCLREALALDARQPDALSLLGVVLCRSGRAGEAIEPLRRATGVAPQVAGYQINLGNALRLAGRADEATKSLEAATRLDPANPDAHFNLALAADESGEAAVATAAFERACALAPDAAYRLAYGEALHRRQRHADAARVFAEAVALAPGLAAAHAGLGMAEETLGRHAQAARAYRRAIELDATNAPLHFNLGNALRAAGDEAAAESAYLRALELQPDHARAANNLGLILALRGDHAGAQAWHRRATDADTSLAEAHMNLGCALGRLGRGDEALDSFARAQALRPAYAEAEANRGVVLHRLGRYEQALAAFDTALAQRPELVDAAVGRATALFEVGELDASHAAYAKVLALWPDDAVALGNVAATIVYSDRADRAAVYGAQRRHAALRRLESLRREPASRPPDPHRRLRVGFVSADLRRHSVAAFMEPLLRARDHSGFELFAYHNHRGGDEVTDRLRGGFDAWRDIAAHDDEAVFEGIRADGIDILIDLSGLTAGNRLGVFARKPAPVQMTWLGYLTSTGLEAIDWRITDYQVDPAGYEAWQTERPLRLRGCYLCFEPPGAAPEVAAPAQGPPLFVSFNNLAKVSPSCIALWSRLLREVPQARLRLKSPPLGDPWVRRRVSDRFAAHGIDTARLDLLGWQRGEADHLALYADAHVALDTWPYNGVTTTCEALWMGVPVVSLVGKTHAARQGLTLLGAVGLEDLAVSDPDAYVATAAALVRDGAQRDDLRSRLRARMRASPLTDAAGFTRKLETAWRRAWLHHCAPEQADAPVETTTHDLSQWESEK
jgi:predicted O-linked N-acetylglucosamine transferase (SPINDLY family)